MTRQNLEEQVIDALTLYFILGIKQYKDQACKVLENSFKQKKEGDAIEAIFSWFKKFRGNYRSERNAVKSEFLRWYEVKDVVS